MQAEYAETIATGCLSLDWALGDGGFPRRSICELFGQESSGKTTIALLAVAAAQRMGGRAAFVDAEHALDPEYAGALGVDTTELLFTRPDDGEQALLMTQTLLSTCALDILVVDSVAALLPREEREAGFLTQSSGLQTRMLSGFLRKLNALVAQSECCLLFLNQIRSRLRVTVGDRETTVGGDSLRMLASVRAEIRVLHHIQDERGYAGNRTIVHVRKNRFGKHGREAEFDLLAGAGFALESDLIALGLRHGLVQYDARELAFRGHRMGFSHGKAIDFLKRQPDVRIELHAALRHRLGLSPALYAAAGSGV